MLSHLQLERRTSFFFFFVDYDFETHDVESYKAFQCQKQGIEEMQEKLKLFFDTMRLAAHVSDNNLLLKKEGKV